MAVSRYCACTSAWTGNVYNYIDGGKQGPGSYHIFVYGVVGKFIGLQIYLLLVLMERLQILTEAGKGLKSTYNKHNNAWNNKAYSLNTMIMHGTTKPIR